MVVGLEVDPAQELDHVGVVGVAAVALADGDGPSHGSTKSRISP